MKKQLKLKKITEIPLEPPKWPKPFRISKMTTPIGIILTWFECQILGLF